MTKKLLVAAVVGVLSLCGCAKNPPQSIAMTESDPVVSSLNDAAMRIARAAEQSSLASSVRDGSRSRVTEQYRLDLSKVPPEMRAPLLLEGGFNGELEIFLKSLTDAVGWAPPVVLGARPATPLIVSFTEQRRPPAYWIADAGYQAGQMADVSINSSLHQVIVRYHEGMGDIANGRR